MKTPQIDSSVYLAEGARVLGDVVLAAGCSVWYNAVIRGDISSIRVGRGTNIQDCCVLHTDHNHCLMVGENVTVGHGTVLHGCTVGDGTLVGMGSTILSGAVIGKGCLIGGGALVTGNTIVPDDHLVLGCPAKVIRPLNDAERAQCVQGAEEYRELADEAMAEKK